MTVRSNRPVCGSCHEEIVGVVPVWRDGVSVCRNCAYSGSFNRFEKKIEKNGHIPKNKARVHPRSRIRLAIGIFVLIAGIIIVGLKAKEFALVFQPERPYYRGAVNLDRDAESCISNLWKITVLLQNGVVSWPVLKCPITGMNYKLVHVKGNSIVSCPNPERHHVTGIRVSRLSPVPEVEL